MTIKYDSTLKLIYESIFQGADEEEVARRLKEFKGATIKDFIEMLDKKGKLQRRRDGTYDVNGTLDLENLRLYSLKEIPLKINKVDGHFRCANNNLTSLEGAPKEVTGSFMCTSNRISKLENIQDTINKNFNCSYNKLTSLEGAPTKVLGSFACLGNKLTDIKDAPKEVGGDFRVSNNAITSLEGSPTIVNGQFSCDRNLLTSLKGAPRKIGGNFVIDVGHGSSARKTNHNRLTSLEGGPEEVGGNLFIDFADLTSLDGFPKKIGGDVHGQEFEGRKLKFKKSDITKISNISGKIYLY